MMDAISFLGSSKISQPVFSFITLTWMSSFSCRKSWGKIFLFSQLLQCFILIRQKYLPFLSVKMSRILPSIVDDKSAAVCRATNRMPPSLGRIFEWNFVVPREFSVKWRRSRISLSRETEERGTDADERGVHSIHPSTRSKPAATRARI